MLEILLFFVYIFAILLGLLRWEFVLKSELTSKKIFILFSVKLCFSFLLYFIYTKYYTDRTLADIFKFYDDAKLLYTNVYNNNKTDYWKIVFGIDNDQPSIYQELKKLQYWFEPNEATSYNDNRIVIRMNLLLYPFTKGFYLTQTLIFSLLSFIGLIALFRFAKEFLKISQKKGIISVFLIPSVLFWGSGNLKESILLFALGFYVFYLFKTLKNRNLSNISMLILSILLLTYTKSYVLLSLIPGTLSLLISTGFKFKKTGFIYMFSMLSCLIGLVVVTYFVPEFDIIKQIQTKQMEFNSVAIEMHAASRITLPVLDNTIYSILINSPIALINTFARPTFFDATSVLSFLASLENLGIYLLVLLAIISPIKPTENQKQFIYFTICFTVLLCIFIGLIVPVLGAIVRYKIPYLPLLYLSLLSIIDFQKIRQKFKIVPNGK
jgi:hypothetical protein